MRKRGTWGERGGGGERGGHGEREGEEVRKRGTWGERGGGGGGERGMLISLCSVTFPCHRRRE